MVVTRATRNRFVGVEPARGFESHHLRQNRSVQNVLKAVLRLRFFHRGIIPLLTLNFPVKAMKI